MRKPRFKLTYANIMSSFAVFLALGGVSYAAATLPKNSVGTKQIKKNAVTAAKIKKNAVTATKIKANSITGSKVKAASLSGSDINLASLGSVPNADTAKTASDKYIVLKRSGVSATDNDEATARAAATEIALYSYGQVSVYGKCWKDADDDRVYAGIFARTNTNGALAVTYNDLSGEPLNTDTPEDSRYFLYTYKSNGGTTSDYDYDANILIGTDGVGLRVSNVIAIANEPGSLPAFYPAAESCVFSSEGTKTSG